MRKKSKKKQIVAMTLALSVLSSSVGMCGASAAEALSDTDDSGLQVTVVPLADNTETPAPTAESKTPAQKEETPAENEQPVASTGDNTDQPTDGEGEGDGDNDTSSDDKPTIERPEQSDTVETLPGTAEDNKDHIKGEDKDDTEDKGDSGEETPGTGDTDTGDTEEKGEEGSGSEETPEQPKETPETPEEKPEETPKEDDTDYSCAYDPDTGHFKVTFNIKEDAEGDQTIELSKVQEVVRKNGESYLDTDEGKAALEEAQMWGDKTMKYTHNGVTYIYTLATGTVSLYQEPGCTTIFDISLSNGSKHTYVYKDNSLTVATPDMKNDDKTGIKGFDGQELPEDYVKSYLTPKYNLTDPDADGVIENIIDKALESSESNRQYYVDANGNLTTTYTKPKITAGTPVKEINGKYYVYSEASDCYYGGFSASQVKKDANGQYVVKTTTSSKVSSAIKEDGSKYYAPWVRGSEIDATRPSASRVQTELNKYFKKNNTSLDQEVLKYYNEKDGTSYTTIEELLANNTEAEKELTGSESSNAALNPLKVRSSDQYDNFYQNILSFNVGDPSDIDESNPDHGHGHGSWASDGKEMTIGDYMAGKLNETPGAWDKANSYFNTLLANGMSEDEATWAAFTMATNIDGLRAGNDYQNTAWNWYASMVLHQADGTLDLTKTDKDTGEIIGDDEGEGQTSFYLWKYETDKKTGEKNPMYCTYVEPTYTTNEDGEQVLEKDGFYCWVKYDPSKDKLTYTVTTTNGKLNIDYALLENVVYYLQEAIAPDGYDIDPEIYIICDEESYKELEGTEVTNPATGATSKVTADSWLGSILGGKTLSINFVNTATVPDPEPTPDPDPVPPVEPDIPVDPANPDNPPVQDETPDETPVTPENPQNPAVQDAAPDAAALPQTGTTSWMAGVLASLGSLLLACGWFFTRKQYSPKH